MLCVAQRELGKTAAVRCVCVRVRVCANSRAAVVLAEDLRPLLAAGSQSVGHDVPEPLHHGPLGTHKLPQVRVVVSDGGL